MQEFDNMFRVELFRNLSPMEQNVEKTSENDGETSEEYQKNGINDTQWKIMELLLEDEKLSATKLAEQIGIAKRNVKANIKKLKEQGLLVRHGAPKNGYWEVIDNQIK